MLRKLPRWLLTGLYVVIFAVPPGAGYISGQPALVDQLKDAIKTVRTNSMSSRARYEAEKRLASLTSQVLPKNVDDATLADLISLLDITDDSVRGWVAVSLGNLGVRARPAIPKLLAILAEVENCKFNSLSSAAAIRPALSRMGEKPPPEPQCGKAKK